MAALNVDGLQRHLAECRRGRFAGTDLCPVCQLVIAFDHLGAAVAALHNASRGAGVIECDAISTGAAVSAASLQDLREKIRFDAGLASEAMQSTRARNQQRTTKT